MRRLAGVALLGLWLGGAFSAWGAEGPENRVWEVLGRAADTVEGRIVEFDGVAVSGAVEVELVSDGQPYRFSAQYWCRGENYRVDVTRDGRLALQCVVTPERTLWVPHTAFPWSDAPPPALDDDALNGPRRPTPRLADCFEIAGLGLDFTPAALYRQQRDLLAFSVQGGNVKTRLFEADPAAFVLTVEAEGVLPDPNQGEPWPYWDHRRVTLSPPRKFALTQCEIAKRLEPRAKPPAASGVQTTDTRYQAEYVDSPRGPLPQRVVHTVAEPQTRIWEGVDAVSQQMIDVGYNLTLTFGDRTWGDVPEEVFTREGLAVPDGVTVYPAVADLPSTRDREKPARVLPPPPGRPQTEPDAGEPTYLGALVRSDLSRAGGELKLEFERKEDLNQWLGIGALKKPVFTAQQPVPADPFLTPEKPGPKENPFTFLPGTGPIRMYTFTVPNRPAGEAPPAPPPEEPAAVYQDEEVF